MAVRAMPLVKVPGRAAADSTVPSSPVVRRKFCSAGQRRDVPAFPLAPACPELPPALADELLDFYAFILCQGGSRHVGLTFEHFLLVVETVVAGRRHPTCEDEGDLSAHAS